MVKLALVKAEVKKLFIIVYGEYTGTADLKANVYNGNYTTAQAWEEAHFILSAQAAFTEEIVQESTEAAMDTTPSEVSSETELTPEMQAELDKVMDIREDAQSEPIPLEQLKARIETLQSYLTIFKCSFAKWDCESYTEYYELYINLYEHFEAVLNGRESFVMEIQEMLGTTFKGAIFWLVRLFGIYTLNSDNQQAKEILTRFKRGLEKGLNRTQAWIEATFLTIQTKYTAIDGIKFNAPIENGYALYRLTPDGASHFITGLNENFSEVFTSEYQPVISVVAAITSLEPDNNRQHFAGQLLGSKVSSKYRVNSWIFGALLVRKEVK